MKRLIIIGAFLFALTVQAIEYHVAKTGNDAGTGLVDAPLQTVCRAAELAQPGDTITVHEGIYREEVAPPRGGTSNQKRITYQAAPGENVEIRGSEVVTGWEKGWVKDYPVWKTEIPNALFGNFNPFADEVSGDWFNPKGRKHHTGCVYQDGEWLFEVAAKEELFGKKEGANHPFINMAWLSVNGSEHPAADYTESGNLKKAESTEPCGSCIGWIYNGSWAGYADVDFKSGAEKIDLRLAIPSQTARVEIRLDGKDGKKIGECYPVPTGDWQNWKTFPVAIEKQCGKHSVYIVFRLPSKKSWYAEVGDNTTTVWASFGGENPNNSLTEINVRQTVFYPRKPFVNYITVRGFTMSQAAPKWAPPTAEQMGLIGTHWSKGWIIENNTILHSINAGVSLGKYGDEFDNAGATAEAYLDSIDRARSNGWNKETIGGHIVRNNEISWCEQVGIVGSMGASFSTITGNHIHHIHTQGRFTGAEMAGIKFHAPIDMLIANNCIHDTCLGIWLDWMTQGTRVTRNLLYNNGEDLFLEVNHGPFVIDNNLFLSRLVKHHSQGGAYVHNLFGGIVGACTDERHTPYFKAHSTEKVADHVLNVGDDRFYNNMFFGKNGSHIDAGWWEGMQTHKNWRFGYGLWVYDSRPLAPQTGGNIYYDGAMPYTNETAVVVATQPNLKIEEKGDEVFLSITIDPEQLKEKTQQVTSDLLGKAQVPDLPFETPDGSPLKIDTDYFSQKRDVNNPMPGPFENPGSGRVKLQVWPNP